MVCPSVSCCIHVLGLQVAITVGHDEDLSGKLILGLLEPRSSGSTVEGVVIVMVIVGTFIILTLSLSCISMDVTLFSVEASLSLWLTTAKNCQVDSNAST